MPFMLDIKHKTCYNVVALLEPVYLYSLVGL